MMMVMMLVMAVMSVTVREWWWWWWWWWGGGTRTRTGNKHNQNQKLKWQWTVLTSWLSAQSHRQLASAASILMAVSQATKQLDAFVAATNSKTMCEIPSRRRESFVHTLSYLYNVSTFWGTWTRNSHWNNYFRSSPSPCWEVGKAAYLYKCLR